MVADKDEFVGKTQRTEAGGEGDLGGFIHDADVKGATRKQSAARIVNT